VVSGAVFSKSDVNARGKLERGKMRRSRSILAQYGSEVPGRQKKGSKGTHFFRGEETGSAGHRTSWKRRLALVSRQGMERTTPSGRPAATGKEEGAKKKLKKVSGAEGGTS